MDLTAVGIDLGIIAAIGAALSLDRRAAFQFMLSQPLVAVALLGLVLGDLTTGLWLGAVLQLLWMSSALFGANVPPHETVASVVIGGAVLLAGRYGATPDVVSCTIGILFGVPFAFLGRRVEVWQDHRNLKLAEAAEKNPQRVGMLVAGALARSFMLNAWVVAAGTAIVMAAVWWVGRGLSGPPRAAIASIGVYGIPTLALAVALSGLRRRRAWVIAGASLGATLLVLGGEL